MKAWRQLLTFFALSVCVALFPAQAQSEVENASLAASGLQAFGRLLRQLTSPGGDPDAQLDAVAAFVKPLLAELGASKEGEKAAEEHVDRAVLSLRERQALQEQMEEVAAAIDDGATGEERHRLKRRMFELLSAHSSSLFETAVQTYQALGMSRKEAETAINRNPPLYLLGSLIHATAVGKYYEYALLPRP
ncbi:hypothetical protein Emag_001234 [Eimeria magna]